jgi:hypothetical protein
VGVGSGHRISEQVLLQIEKSARLHVRKTSGSIDRSPSSLECFSYIKLKSTTARKIYWDLGAGIHICLQQPKNEKNFDRVVSTRILGTDEEMDGWE